MVIGNGVMTGSGAASSFSNINWGSSNFFTQVEIDFGSGMVDVGTTQLWSVPYALYSKTSGTPGVTGPTGAAGTNGVDGPTGPTGVAGTNGNNGINGATGPQGPAGNDGVNGATGPQGPTGNDGINGAIGQQGPTGNDGVNGATGQQGPTGNNGINGATGQQGPTGNDGVNGATGQQGPTGNDGVNGATGSQGPTGNDGVNGATGPQGPTGVTGSTGATGATGAGYSLSYTGRTSVPGYSTYTVTTGAAYSAGARIRASATVNGGVNYEEGTVISYNGTSMFVAIDRTVGTPTITGTINIAGDVGSIGLSQYAYIYNTIAQSIIEDANVNFNTTGISTGGILHNNLTNPDQITISVAGVYKVAFSVTATGANQFALYLDPSGLLPNAPIAGTMYGTGAGTQQNTGQAIISVAIGGGVLTLKNHTTSPATVNLPAGSGGTQNKVNASIIIEKLD